MSRVSHGTLAILFSVIALSARAHAQRAQPVTVVEKSEPQPYVLGGYVEASYQWNFNRPSNGVTNYRGFDNRHNTFTIANVALDAQWDYENVIGRLTLQVGHTPSTYYLAEPRHSGSAAANETSRELWKYLQQAFVGYRFTDGLSVTAGLFLSPIGPESMAVRDNWNWSRSNLFFGLPFYHTGARATYSLKEAWAFTLAAYNGWNSVVDNNRHKSLSTQATFTRDKLALSLLYFGGVERAQSAQEKPWRHLFDAHATWMVTEWLSLLAHANAGLEQGSLGARWLAGALYARARLVDSLFLAARGDLFHERKARGSDAGGAIFWPVSLLSSATVTLDYRPGSRISFRLEYRRDYANGPLYYGKSTSADPETDTWIANRRAQNTLTAGATAWF